MTSGSAAQGGASTDWSFSAAMNYLSQQLGMFNAQLLDLNKRHEDGRDRMGALNEQQREAIAGVRDRIDAVELDLTALRPLVETIGKTLSEIRPIIERQVEHAARVAEAARSETITAGARYQESLSQVQVDFEERQAALRADLGALVTEAAGSAGDAQAVLSERMGKLETQLNAQRREDTEVAKARITTRGMVTVAAITIIAGGIISGIISIIVSILKQGVP
jgi:hypothetical protein